MGMLGTKCWFFARTENALTVQALSLGLQSRIFNDCTFFLFCKEMMQMHVSMHAQLCGHIYMLVYMCE